MYSTIGERRLHLPPNYRVYLPMIDHTIPNEVWHEIFGHLLGVDFWEPFQALSYTWRDRHRNYDLQARHKESWDQQGPLRLVCQHWKALVEAYPYSWLRLRMQLRDDRRQWLSIRPITSSYTYIRLRSSVRSDVTSVSDTTGITTLSLILREALVAWLFQNTIDSLPTMPRLQALRLDLPRDLNYEYNRIPCAVLQLLRAVKSSLLSFHLVTERPLPPLTLPKLQHFRLTSAPLSLTMPTIEHWQLPSLRHLDVPPPNNARYWCEVLAPAFGAQLRSLSALTAATYQNGDAFWEKFPALMSLHLHGGGGFPSFVAPPAPHPMRELVLSGDPQAPRYALVAAFVGVAEQAGRRRVVLAHWRWTEDCLIFQEMVLSDSIWKKVAQYVEDELGETLASASLRFELRKVELAREVCLPRCPAALGLTTIPLFMFCVRWLRCIYLKTGRGARVKTKG
jgi:hypothetical protein